MGSGLAESMTRGSARGNGERQYDVFHGLLLVEARDPHVNIEQVGAGRFLVAGHLAYERRFPLPELFLEGLFPVGLMLSPMIGKWPVRLEKEGLAGRTQRCKRLADRR